MGRSSVALRDISSQLSRDNLHFKKKKGERRTHYSTVHVYALLYSSGALVDLDFSAVISAQAIISRFTLTVFITNFKAKFGPHILLPTRKFNH